MKEVETVKICPKCLAEYDDKEAPGENDFCIECYGECVDAQLIDKNVFMKTTGEEDLWQKKEKLKVSHLAERSKKVLMNRIEKLIVEKRGMP
ncbi:hypothetical protein Tfer_0231 [Thermincola ferriacetica]|uniref:Uncharacterized protein n=1 Tax=Thermincola ferriacetica TaxID=281456 RepID=A0A0L6W6Z6_9FIRM|nr:hypothetical protein Tfer_0231 [Thermincola ferriacetica]